MSTPPPIRKLQYVLAVARDLHFRRAAERLNVSQPYVSRQIKEFEEELGFQIFRRAPVSLTPSGQELAVRFGQMMSRFDAEFQAAVDAARSANHRAVRDFTIGHCGSISSELRREIGNVLRENIPKLRVRFRIIPVAEMPEALGTGRLQLAVALSPPQSGDLEQTWLACDRFVAVVTANSSLSSARQIRITELNRKPLIMQDYRRTHPALYQMLSRRFSDEGLRPHVVEEAVSVQEALDLVQHSIGIAVLPAAICRPTEPFRLIDIQDINPIDIVLLRHAKCSDLTREIASIIAESISPRKPCAPAHGLGDVTRPQTFKQCPGVTVPTRLMSSGH